MKLPDRPPEHSQNVRTAVSAILALAAAASAQAGPQDGVVTSGTATISAPAAGQTRIDQTSSSVGIDWRSFNIGVDEQVRFVQPSSSAVALNRIHDQDPSLIQGSLIANGRVFLLNPNGIIFGQAARINVGSLVASSLDLTTADAATGTYTFATTAQRSGAIVNDGQLVAADGGSITLLGGAVQNNGLVVANYGTVNLGAGRAATLDFDGDGLLRFQIDAGLAGGAETAVGNSGNIQADGGQVLLTARLAGDLLARAVNNEGVIRAARIDNSGGRIRLVGDGGAVVNSGRLDAAAADAFSSGGEVQVLGRSVELTGTAVIDVRGSNGGGTALLGGGFGGADPALPNAQHTRVQAGALIDASSTLGGDAGSVAVWADGTTLFSGEVHAQALGADGNGGFVEISGGEHLGIDGHARLESRHGVAGTLLLDPGSVTIEHDGAADPAPPTDPTPEQDVLTDRWISEQLASGSVTISTADSTNDDAEDLTMLAGATISWNTGSTLVLRGADSVTLQAGSSIVGTGAGASLALQSSNGAVTLGTVSLDGDLTVNARGPIGQVGTLEVAGAASFTTRNNAGAAITLDNGANRFGTVAAATRNAADTGNVVAAITLNELDGTALAGVRTGGNLLVTSGGSITQSAALSVGGAATFTAAAGQAVTLDDSANNFTGAVGFAAAGAGTLQDVSIAAASGLQLQALTLAGGLLVNAGGAITQVAGTSLAAATMTLAADGDIGTAADPLRLAGDTTLSATSTDGINVQSAGAIRLATIQAGDDAALVSTGGSILDDGAATAISADALTLQAVGAIGEQAGSGAGTLDLQVGSVAANAAGGGVYLTAAGNLRLRTIQAAGPVWLYAPGGSIVADSPTASITGGAAGVHLRALNNIGTVTDLAALQGEAIAVNTGGALSAQVSSATGQVNLRLPAGSAPTAAAGAISAGSAGRLLLQSPGDLSLAGLTGAIAGFTQVGFSSGGVLNTGSGAISGMPGLLVLRGVQDIIDADRSLDLAAGRLVFQSGGLGGATTLVTAANQLDASLGGGASLTVNNSGALTLGSVSAGGNLTINAADLLDDGDVGSITQLDAGGTMTLVSAAGIGRQDGSSGGRIDVGNATLLLQSGAAGAYVSSGGNLQLGGGQNGGRVDIVAPSGNITVTGNLNAGGPLALTAGSTGTAGNILLTGTAQAGQTATLRALGGGTISDSADAASHLVAVDAHLEAANVGSATNALNASLASLEGTASNAFHINLAGGAQLRGIAAPTIAISATGALTDDGVATTRVSGNSVTLSASTIGATGAGIGTAADTLALASNGAIHVAEVDGVALAAISATGPGNDITITAGGAITDEGNAATRIEGGQLTLSGTALGTANNPLGTQVAMLDANTSGGLYLNEADDLQVGAIGAQRIEISAAGYLTDDGNDSTRLSAPVIVLAAQSVGAADNRIDTAAGTLSASASSGGVYVGELDDLVLGTLSTPGIVLLSAAGAITDGTATSLTAAQANLAAGAIGTAGNPLGTALGTLTASSSAGGMYFSNDGALTVTGLNATGGAIGVQSSAAFIQSGNIATDDTGIDVDAASITMQADATTRSTGGDIGYVAHNGDVVLGTLDAATGRVLVISSAGVYSAAGFATGAYNLVGTAMEVRAGGLTGSAQIGTGDAPLAIDATGAAARSVYLVVPATNGVQDTTPQVSLAGPSRVLLVKGYSGSGAGLLFDRSSAFTANTVAANGESILPLFGGRVAVNTESLGAASAALSSGVVNRANVDWAAFDPNVSLFNTVGPAVRLPDDQVDEAPEP